jgi:hypothetical protein
MFVCQLAQYHEVDMAPIDVHNSVRHSLLEGLPTSDNAIPMESNDYSNTTGHIINCVHAIRTATRKRMKSNLGRKSCKRKAENKKDAFFEIAKIQTLLATGLLLDRNEGTLVGPPRFVVVGKFVFDEFGFGVREQWRLIDSISPSSIEDILSAPGVFPGRS